MEKYCNLLNINPDDYNLDQHAQVYLLRHKDKKTYQEIADQLKLKLDLVSFYINTDPTKPWVLADWITGYYVKDSSRYEKVDILIDCDPRLVDKFKRSGRTANFVEKV